VILGAVFVQLRGKQDRLDRTVDLAQVVLGEGVVLSTSMICMNIWQPPFD
jgi:hypothetical protein